MNRFIDLTGQRFYRLIIIKMIGKDQNGHILWLCRCDCGKEKIIYGHSLRNGITKSCGCLSKEKSSLIHRKHGMRNSLIYGVWCEMKQRCNNPNCAYYKSYGGRGIKVCDRLMDKESGFENFLADVGLPEKGMTLDRINVNGNYCPKNHRWSTRKEQARNRRNTPYAIIDGKIEKLLELSIKYNVPYKTLKQRVIGCGWDIKRALTTPVKKYNKRK